MTRFLHFGPLRGLFTGNGLTLAQCLSAEKNPAPANGASPSYAVMDYYDGNTATALRNSARNHVATVAMVSRSRALCSPA